MTSSTAPAGELVQYVAVSLSSFGTGRAPLVDLYHEVGGERVLYCEAQKVFSAEAHRRLLDSDVSTLYVRLDGGRTVAGVASLPDLLGEPDQWLAPVVKARILYHSALNLAHQALIDPADPSSRQATVQLVGAVTLTLQRSPASFQALVGMMRHNFTIYTRAVNVCTYAVALGRLLGLSQGQLEVLGMGAFLRDVGMTRVSDAILRQALPLTRVQWLVIRRHPNEGVAMLELAGWRDPFVLGIVSQHHERLDGSGYPRQLEAASIHPMAQLTALVDSYDAMTSTRPFRAALSPFAALRELKREVDSVRHYNRDFFVALVELLGEEAARREIQETERGT